MEIFYRHVCVTYWQKAHVRAHIITRYDLLAAATMLHCIILSASTYSSYGRRGWESLYKA